MAGRRPNGPRCGSSSTAKRLYMGVLCFDSEPDRLLGNTMKRDEDLLSDDRFMWTIDTFLDQQSGYLFEMNPSGLMADSLMGLRYPRQQGPGTGSGTRTCGAARSAGRSRSRSRSAH